MSYFSAFFAISIGLFVMTPSSKGAEAQGRKLAFYEVKPASSAPDAEGRLPEASWKEVPMADNFYEYWKAEPGQGAVKTAFQMVYDKAGIYLRITNYEDRMDKIRALIHKRGDPDLWTDDSVELFIDPQGRGIGYLCFTINSLGARAKRKQLDAAVSLPGWRGDNWTTWAEEKPDAWVLEVYFPWADLGRTGAAGDVWMFNQTRFAYTSGSFQGVTWAPGANYARPGNFGFLYFGTEQKASPERVATVLKSKVMPPWMVAVDSAVLRYTKDQVETLSGADLTTDARQRLSHEIARLKSLPRLDEALTIQMEHWTQMAGELPGKTAGEALNAAEKINAAAYEASEAFWKQSIHHLLQ